MALIDKYTNDEFTDFVKNSFSYRGLLHMENMLLISL